MLARWLTPLRIAVVVGAVLALLRVVGGAYLHLLDVRAMDFRLLQRGPIAPGGETVIVAIDNASIAAVGRWPWPRAIVARLVDALAAADPAVIGFDVVFSEPSTFDQREPFSARAPETSEEAWHAVQRALRAQDDRLAVSLRASGRAVLGYFADLDAPDAGAPPRAPRAPSTYDLVQDSDRGARYVLAARAVRDNLPAFASAARDAGFFNVGADRDDGVTRRVPLAIRVGDRTAVPLALAVLRAYRPGDTLAIRLRDFGVDEVRVGTARVPVAEDGHLLVNYRGPAATFPTIPALDVLRGAVAPDALRGKIVLVGLTATAVGDTRVTPFDQQLPGVELHANVIDNILRRDFVARPKWLVAVDVAAIAAVALALGAAMRRVRGIGAAALALVAAGAYLAATQWLFVARGVPLSIVYPLVAIALTYAGIALQHYLVEEREKRKLRTALELYLSPSMAHLVSEQPERLALGGEKRELTVLFSDIRGFTTLSERRDPAALVELLNRYLGEMTDVVFAHDGMLDKYIGDAVMAVWGAPLAQADHARRACRTALEMQARLATLNRAWQADGWPPLAIGVGLNTGPMIFGNMGSTRHLSLTVVGDHVNLASRLEGLTKIYGAAILASQATVDAAGAAVVAREIDVVRVKGKDEPVHLYEILAPGDEHARWAAVVTRFGEALAAYRQRRWVDAREGFLALLAERPDDGPARLYVERCTAMAAHPPGPEWDGVTVMETK